MTRRASPALLLGFCVAISGPLLAYEMKEFPLPAGSNPNFIITGPDGNMWFTEPGTDNIGVITAAGSITHHFQVGCLPVGIALGADGKVWFNCTKPTGVNHYLEDTRFFTKYDIFSNTYAATGALVATPNGLIAFAEKNSDGEVEIFTTAGEFSGLVDTSPNADTITGLAAGGDGNIWLTFTPAFASSEGYFCHVNVSTLGTCVGSTAANPIGVTWSPLFGAAVFANGTGESLFYECSDTVSNGYICSGAAPTSTGAGSNPQYPTTAPDGTVWYTDSGKNEIGHLRLDGPLGGPVIDHYPIPTANAHPYGIAVAPDSTVWFTELDGQKIGRLRVKPFGDVNGDGVVDVSDVFYLINFLFAGGPPPQ